MASEALLKKLSPYRFDGMSLKMAGIVSYILSHDYKLISGETQRPYRMHDFSVSSDGFVTGFDTDHGSIFIGSVADLRKNLSRLAVAAELNKEEIEELHKLYSEKVDSWEIGFNT